MLSPKPCLRFSSLLCGWIIFGPFLLVVSWLVQTYFWWFGSQFAKLLNAEKVLIQKSGYYSRAAASNKQDLALIKECADKAVEAALQGIGGVVGHDEDQNDELRAIEFPRIAGGKPFNIDEAWFDDVLAGIGQAKGTKVEVAH